MITAEFFSEESFNLFVCTAHEIDKKSAEIVRLITALNFKWNQKVSLRWSQKMGIGMFSKIYL
jgi:hypothetical protein